MLLRDKLAYIYAAAAAFSAVVAIFTGSFFVFLISFAFVFAAIIFDILGKEGT